MKRLAALAAILATALNALWPLIAQAEPGKSPFVAVVCTSGNGIHAMDLTGKPGGARSSDHCKLCVASGDRFAVLPVFAAPVLQIREFQVRIEESSRSEDFDSVVSLSPPPRGPPAVL